MRPPTRPERVHRPGPERRQQQQQRGERQPEAVAQGHGVRSRIECQVRGWNAPTAPASGGREPPEATEHSGVMGCGTGADHMPSALRRLGGSRPPLAGAVGRSPALPSITARTSSACGTACSGRCRGCGRRPPGVGLAASTRRMCSTSTASSGTPSPTATRAAAGGGRHRPAAGPPRRSPRSRHRSTAALDGVPQLADVPRPAVPQQRLRAAGVNPATGLAGPGRRTGRAGGRPAAAGRPAAPAAAAPSPRSR